MYNLGNGDLVKRESVVVGAAPCLGQSLSFDEARAWDIKVTGSMLAGIASNASLPEPLRAKAPDSAAPSAADVADLFERHGVDYY